jgi:AraC-like DNA-binding protein
VPHVLRLSTIAEGFPLVVDRHVGHAPTGLHSHDFTELVVILGGRGVHYSSDEQYGVATGDAFVVTTAHGYRDVENLDLVNILFDPRQLALPLAEARKIPGYHAFFALEPRYRKEHGFASCLHLDPDRLAQVSTLAADMETELRRREPGFELMAATLLMELICRLSRAYGRMRGEASRPLIRLGTVLSYVEQHHAEPIRATDLERIARLSPSSLLRAFTRITGMPPMRYVTRLRITRACELLRTGDGNVTEVAFRVGFGDSNYFSRQFRQVMGCTPREYARRWRRSEPQGPGSLSGP